MAPGIETEIIVVDDASAPAISTSDLGPATRVVRLDENQGPAAARNVGVGNATGDLIAFLDCDDIWLENKLAHQTALWQQASKTIDTSRLVITSAFYILNRRKHRVEIRTPFSSDSRQHYVAGCWMSPGSTLLAHRSVFQIVGRQDDRLRRLEDYDWMLRFGESGGTLVVSPSPDVVIAPSWSQRYDEVAAAAKIIREKLCGGTKSQQASHHQRSRDAYLDLELAQAALLNGRRSKAMWHLGKSLLRKPRLSIAVEKLSDVATDVPDDISALYDEILF